jgi:hypothetical protein
MALGGTAVWKVFSAGWRPGLLPALVLLGCAAAANAAPVLYGVNSADEGLSAIDPSSGATTFIGRLSPDAGEFPVTTSLAAQPGTGRLYTWNNDVGTNGLLTIDPATGAGTHVAPEAPSRGKNFHSLAFSPDGTLYGLSGGIFEIDLATGQPTELAPGNFLPGLSGADFGPGGILFGATSGGALFIDISIVDGSWQSVIPMIDEDGMPFGAQIQSIVFDPTGNLIGSAYVFSRDVDRVYDVVIRRQTAWVRLAGEEPGEPGSAIDPATGIEYAFQSDGRIVIAIDPDGNPAPLVPDSSTLIQTVTLPSRDVIFDLDPSTGSVTNLRDTSEIMQGLAFIPEPSTGALLALGLCTLASRRRRFIAPRDNDSLQNRG